MQKEEENTISSLEGSNDLGSSENISIEENPSHESVLESSNEDSFDKNETENELDTEPSQDIDEKTSVRRLSLFDNLETDKSQSEMETSTSDAKAEPILNEEENIALNTEESIKSDHQEDTLDPDLHDSSTSDEQEFNQENDEELLDIPTFLRRQAN